MGLFFRKDVYLADDILTLKKKVSDLELEIEKLKSHIISVRGFVNRRYKNQDLEDEEEESKDPYNGVLAKVK